MKTLKFVSIKLQSAEFYFILVMMSRKDSIPSQVEAILSQVQESNFEEEPTLLNNLPILEEMDIEQTIPGNTSKLCSASSDSNTQNAMQ